VANDAEDGTPIRCGLPNAAPFPRLNPTVRSPDAGTASRKNVRPSDPPSSKNEKCVEEPDELLKTSHLKSDKTPILMSL
jgi:hypothetical protein